MGWRTVAARWLRGLSILPSFWTVLGPVPSAAHPEVVLTAVVVPVFDAAGRLGAIQEKWSFDYEYSALVGMQLDRNGDGVFDVDELLKTIGPGGILAWLTEKDYLTRVTVAGQTIAHTAAQSITVGVADARLVIEFTVSLTEPQVIARSADLELFDPDIYFGVEFDHSTVESPTAPAWCRIVPLRDESPDPAIDHAAGFRFRVAIDCG